MKKTIIALSMISISTLLTISCENNTETKEATQIHESSNAEKTNNLVKKPESWINDRVGKAKEKLNSSEGGKLVWLAMEAHGGLENWFNKGVISFRFDYMPIGGKNAKKTISNVDVWSNRSVLQDAIDKEDSFGWDGENAWEHRNDAEKFPFDVRFWALTPYYFLGQPFIFDGEGVQIEKLTDLTLNGKSYNAVKITFEAGTGDAPDDYYINLYDKETHLLKALKYIVSAPSRFKKRRTLSRKNNGFI